jgi:hypothetical protein
MSVDGIDSHKPLNAQRQRQCTKIMDHGCCIVEHRAKVIVLCAETKSVTAMQRQFQTVFETQAPARKIYFAFSNNLKKKKKKKGV